MKHHNKNRSRRRKSRSSVFSRNMFQLLEDRRMLATFTVNSLADGVPDATDGLTTLREAIIAANDEIANPGADSIVFQTSLTGRIALTEGELLITDDLTITGPGAAADLVIDAQQNSRAIRSIDSVSNLALDSLTIVNGRTTGDGGGILFERFGDLRNQTSLTLVDSVVSGNTSGGNGGGFSGDTVSLFGSTVSGNSSGGDGGGFSGDFVLLFGSTVSGNSSEGDGGGGNGRFVGIRQGSTVSGNTSDGNGGGINVANSITLRESTVSGNSSRGDGGGIRASSDSVRLYGSTVSGNTSDGDGGGISSGHQARVVESTVSGNSSGGDGGGIRASFGDLTSSTISGNTSGRDGGGIHFNSAAEVLNSTFSGNTAGRVGGGISLNTDFMGISVPAIRLRNSIISGNSDNGMAPNFRAPLEAEDLTVDHSIIGDTTGTTLTAGSGNQLNVDFTTVLETEVVGGVTIPLLTNNGGSVETIALLDSSPAIDAGDNDLAVNSRLLTDQRGDGFARFNDGDGDGIPIVDIGAVESESVFFLGDVSRNGVVDFLDIGPFISLLSSGNFLNEADIDGNGVVDFLDIGPFISILSSGSNSTTFTVNSLTDGTPDATDGLMTLREAIIAANDSTNPGADFIIFEAGLTGEILLDAAQGELVITDDLTITGPGAAGDLVINAQQNSRIIRATDRVSSLKIDSLTISNGSVNTRFEGGGGIRFEGLPGSTLTLTNSMVSGNETQERGTFTANGGGVFAIDGKVTLTNSTVSGNTTGDGGGGGIYTRSGDVTLNNSVVSGNETEEPGTSGGGIYTRYGDVTLTDSEILENDTRAEGGGVLADYGVVTLTNSIISRNTSTWGGGIYTRDGEVTLTDSTISGNTSGSDGGGIASLSSDITLTNSTISGNTSGSDGGAIRTAGGDVTLTNSTISGNTSGDNGGGIESFGGDITLTNSTISGNTSGNNGGGIYTRDDAVMLNNSTVSGNTAGAVGGGIGLLDDDDGESLTVRNSIVAGNSDNGTAPDFLAPGVPRNLSVKHSIIGDTTGTMLTAGNNNLLNVDFTTVLETEVVGGVTVPLLTDNGGTVETIALLAGSPAIDAGDNALAVDAAGDPLPDDQRGTGFGRLIDGNGDGAATVDIGAFEFVSSLPSFLLGDADQNNIVDFLDIGPFISLLSSGDFLDEADIDRSGVVDFLDIGPFISILSSGGSSNQLPISQLSLSSPAPSLLANEVAVADLSAPPSQPSRVAFGTTDLEPTTWKSSGDLFDAHPDLLEGLADVQIDDVLEELLV